MILEDGKISLEGMFDLHVHASPSIMRRRFSALEALKLASAEGMGGFLLLDHTYNTTVIAQILNEMGCRTQVFGAILLNESVGGLNPSVVEAAIQLGTKQIEMPTYSARSHREKYGDDQKNFPYQKRVKGIYILDDRGRLISEVEDILQLLKGSHTFLGTGHLSIPEIEALIDRTRELTVPVLVNSVSTDIIDMPIDVQRELAGDHVFMEHDYAILTEIVHRKTEVGSVVEQIRAVGAERCVIGTDTGQLILPDLVDGLKNFIRQLLENGISENELDLMTRKNPRTLLGIS
ncbi:MAG: hypothetical protein A2169_11545 [Deltaproteobacteria bacterium RBG_13_47_9]|nr:MAG: hypothetical protein A2169_11545 [Deltaproteobacteria bacterium RBG_13_47_9]